MTASKADVLSTNLKMISNRIYILALIFILVSISAAMDDDEIQKIINRHLQYRRSVKSSNMNNLDWSPKLARLARKYVATCPATEQDLDKNATSGEFGFNFGITPYPPAIRAGKPEDADIAIIDSWCMQRRYFVVDKGGSHPFNNWVQIVWADTYKIGCGRKICGNYTAMICLYKTKADLTSLRPYERGDACSACKPNFKQCKRKLCASNQREVEEEEVEEEVENMKKIGEPDMKVETQFNIEDSSQNETQESDQSTSTVEIKIIGGVPIITTTPKGSSCSIFNRVICIYLVLLANLIL